MVGFLLKALRNDRVEIAAEARTDARKRSRLDLLHNAGHLVDRPLGDVIGQTACEQFVEHDPERIHVGPDIETVGCPVELFGGHVGERAHELTDVGVHRGEGRVAVGVSRHAEVDDLRTPRGIDQNVSRLQIAMDDALLMAVSDRPTGLAEERDAVADGEPPLGRIAGDRKGILDVFHHEVGHLASGQPLHAHRVDAADAGVGESAQDLGLMLEPLGGRRGEHAGADHLHGDRPAGHPLEPFVHPPHASFVDEPDDRHVAQGRAGAEVSATGAGSACHELGETRKAQLRVADRLTPRR